MKWLFGVLLHPFRSRAFVHDVYKGVPVAKSDGSKIPWRPGYYLWPDGTERLYAPRARRR